MTTPIVEGNLEDKYHSKNPISKLLVNNFLNFFRNYLSSLPASHIKTICEIGIGEGELLKITHQVFPKAEYYATDVSPNQVALAKNRLQIPINFSVQNAEHLTQYTDNQFDLVICCEVLEHTLQPDKALKELERISKNFVLLSVPNEPIWRLLNLLRGKYIARLGNTPGHFNHWSPQSFNQFIRSEFPYKYQESWPFPWQMKLIKQK